MEKFSIFLLAVMIFIPGLMPVSAEVVPGVLKPDTFHLGANHLYIGEKHRVSIFTLPELEWVRSFGDAGEGPWEFKLGHGIHTLTIDTLDGQLVIGSIGKLSLYTPTGDPLSEIRVPSFSRFVPVKGGYLAHTSLPVEDGLPVQGTVLFDPDLKRKKILLKTSMATGMGAKVYVPAPGHKFLVYKDKIYLSEDPGSISIGIFDLQGNRLTRISHPAEKIKVPSGYIRKLTDHYKTSPDWKNYWNYLKDYLTFPDYFPAVRDFFIDGDLLYLQTYRLKGDQIQWLVFDLAGNLNSEVWLPAVNFYTDQPPLHGILEGTYYYLVENIEQETWELEKLPIIITR